jgi:hypothetical protein
MRYAVEEFVAGKWWLVRVYDTKAEADQHASQIGYKARVRLI